MPKNKKGNKLRTVTVIDGAKTTHWLKKDQYVDVYNKRTKVVIRRVYAGQKVSISTVTTTFTAGRGYSSDPDSNAFSELDLNPFRPVINGVRNLFP
ncbi:MAG: hypothetical protein V4611_00515 [Patescibacteria group bacterium]